MFHHNTDFCVDVTFVNFKSKKVQEDKIFDQQDILYLFLRGRLYEGWISYPVDRAYPLDKFVIQLIVIRWIKSRCTKHG